jgi:carbon storage regulator
MLVLTRKTGQRIMIGDNIEIAVLSTSGEKVRLGISAGKEIPIYREEVYERIKDENGTANEKDGSVDDALRELSNGSKE